MSAQVVRPSAACVKPPTDLMKRFLDWFNNLYPVWLVTLAVIAFFKPQTMLWFDKPWIFWSLAASMLGMGLTLSIDDFKAIWKMPGSVALGFVAQYTIMPLSGWLVATALKLDPGLAVTGSPSSEALVEVGLRTLARARGCADQGIEPELAEAMLGQLDRPGVALVALARLGQLAEFGRGVGRGRLALPFG